MRLSFFLSYSTGSLSSKTLPYRNVLGGPRLLPKSRICPTPVANAAGLHGVFSSVGYLLHGQGSKGTHAWVGVYRRGSPDEDLAALARGIDRVPTPPPSLGDPLSELGGRESAQAIDHIDRNRSTKYETSAKAGIPARSLLRTTLMPTVDNELSAVGMSDLRSVPRENTPAQTPEYPRFCCLAVDAVGILPSFLHRGTVGITLRRFH